jgi:hypothetical protein
MKWLLTSIMAGGLLLGAPLAANAQYLEPADQAPVGTPPDGAVQQQPIQAPLAEAIPADPDMALPGEAVRIVIVDPAVANTQMNALAQSGTLNQIQAEVSADPALAAQLAAANIEPNAVFDVARENGVTTIYASG